MSDPYAGAVPATFVAGQGITSDRQPASYSFKGTTDDRLTVGSGIYNLHAGT